MTSLTFYGGVSEIGGNKIVFEHDDRRLLLDFGMGFKAMGDYFSEYLQPRKCSALEDFFEFGLLPDIPGLYRGDYLRQMGRGPEPRGFDALLLSHAHADHAQYIHFLRPDIPIFCTEETRIMLEAIEVTGSSPLGDLVSHCESFTFYENKKGGLSRVTRRQKEFLRQREYVIMEPGKGYEIGAFRIMMYPVDHSIPGACGFIINTLNGSLAYTGDLRFHGYHPDWTTRFIDESHRSGIRWLITEGTRIEKDELDSEEAVKNDMTRLMGSTKGLVFVEHPIRDLYRVRSIYLAAKDSGREFVVNLKLAYLLRAIGALSPLSLEDVKILIPRKSWGLITRKDLPPHLVKGDYKEWERDFLELENAVTYKELSENPQGYVVSMSFWEINQLTDVRPVNAIWITSKCEPFNPEMEIDEERKKRWLDHFRIARHSAHASGHASRDELLRAVETLKPEVVFPIHTENPLAFKEVLEQKGIKVTLPGLGVDCLL